MEPARKSFYLERYMFYGVDHELLRLRHSDPGDSLLSRWHLEHLPTRSTPLLIDL